MECQCTMRFLFVLSCQLLFLVRVHSLSIINQVVTSSSSASNKSRHRCPTPTYSTDQVSQNQNADRRAFFNTCRDNSALLTKTVAVAAAAAASTPFSASAQLPPLQQPPPTTSIGGADVAYNPIIVGTNDNDNTTKKRLQTKLGQSRIGCSELAPLQQQNIPFFGSNELYYPTFLFGEWNVRAKLVSKRFPYGTSYSVPSAQSLVVHGASPVRNREETVGDVCTYKVRYFSTLANTLSNHLTVNLGTGVPKSKVIQDRSYNIRSISAAYQQLAPTSVDWDYRQNPTKVSLDFGTTTLTDGLQPIEPRRMEIYLTARQSEDDQQDNDKEESAVFAYSEKSRSVSSDGNVVSDTETCTEFVTDPTNPNVLSAVSTVAVFLSPNPNSGRQNGKAIALYDYELQYERVLEEFTTTTSSNPIRTRRACVQTPNDIVQCE